MSIVYREQYVDAVQQPISPRPRIKKLPREMRKNKINFLNEKNGWKKLLLRLKEDSQFVRSSVQFSFLLLCVWIGIEFYFFMQWGASNGEKTFFPRPPGAEGFLPISALISFFYWIHTGIINTVHPSGLFIFLAIVAVSIFLKKAFCSWLCPVGTISESLWKVGEKLFGKNLSVTKWLDYPLRSLKYLLLFFFAYSIATMDVDALKKFIFSPYNKVADIKMYLFFAEVSSFALWTIVGLVAFSVVIKNFWCRYLCPYGALLGALSWLSPFKVQRNTASCIDCELCTKACPSNIKVHTAKTVWSDECMSCLECVQVCPVKNTLDVRTHFTEKQIPNWVYGSLVVGVFVAITGAAMLFGYWQNSITKEEYLHRFQNLDSPAYQHNRGSVPEYSEED